MKAAESATRQGNLTLLSCSSASTILWLADWLITMFSFTCNSIRNVFRFRSSHHVHKCPSKLVFFNISQYLPCWMLSLRVNKQKRKVALTGYFKSWLLHWSEPVLESLSNKVADLIKKRLQQRWFCDFFNNSSCYRHLWWLLLRKSCFLKFCNFQSKTPVLEFILMKLQVWSATLLKRNSNVDVFLWILQNI